MKNDCCERSTKSEANKHTSKEVDDSALANADPEVTNSSPKISKEGENTASANEPEREETPRAKTEIPLEQLSKEIAQFSSSLSLIEASHPLETPKYVDVFLDKVESILVHYETFDPSSTTKFGHSLEDDSSFFMAIHHLTLLVEAVSKFKPTSSSAAILLNMATSQLHRAMLVLEDELRVLLLKWKRFPPNSPSQSNSHKDGSTKDHCMLSDRPKQSDSNNQEQEQEQEPQEGVDVFPCYSVEDISMMGCISRAMTRGGYEDECIKLFMIERRIALEEEIHSQGFEKLSIDDVQRMQWEALEGEIATWINVLKHCTSHLFPGELKFYEAVFSTTPSQLQPNYNISTLLFSILANSVIQQLINLANAVSITKRSSDKLFKFLDMYETLKDLTSWLVESSFMEESILEIKSELTLAEDCLGEAVVLIFNDLETSIKSDNAKQPVPNGAVHPLTRYTMNYLKYACEYKDNLEELFLHHLNTPNDQHAMTSPFTSQIMKIMELLDANLESKSKLYRDPALRYIFLMNNGRYILQKIKGSTEIHQVVGESCRKRSSEIRNYHKSYQRDTWSKVLQCLNPEGLQVNGKVPKLVLKERFKNFNQLFDEIHRSQSSWVVSDEQLRSELRVSISAVMIPAYRAFVARFGQVFTPGRQYEKHVKYQPDDIETAIEELFEGSLTSMVKRKP